MTKADAEQAASDPLSAGQAALAHGAWEDARTYLVEALRQDETPEALEGLSVAASHLHDAPTMFDARQRAYRLYQLRGDDRAAARLATWLALDYATFRDDAKSADRWLQRAHHLLDRLEREPEHGWLAVAEGELALLLWADTATAQHRGAHAVAIGQELGLPELEQQGRMLEQEALVSLEGAVPPRVSTSTPPPAAASPSFVAPRSWRNRWPRRAVIPVGILLAVLLLPVGLVLSQQLRPSSTAMAGTPIAGAATALPATVLAMGPGPNAPTMAPPATTAAGRARPATSMPPTPTPLVDDPPLMAAAAPSIVPPPSPTAVRPSPTATPPAAAAVRQQVAQAEAALRSGQVEATIETGAGAVTRATARMHFDLGDQTRPARLYIITTYHGERETHTVERIIIGEQWWQRQPDGQWTAIPPDEAAWGQVQAFLPQVRSVANMEVATDAVGRPVLRWYDAGRTADVILSFDPATGVPRQLRQVTRGSGTMLTVTYRTWNTPVEITPPAGS